MTRQDGDETFLTLHAVMGALVACERLMAEPISRDTLTKSSLISWRGLLERRLNNPTLESEPDAGELLAQSLGES